MKGDKNMSAITQQALKIMDSLDEAEQITVLRFAEFLAAENNEEAYCLQLLEDYENDADPDKEEAMSIQDFALELGINLE
jgi:predicted transcriptional regulator